MIRYLTRNGREVHFSLPAKGETVDVKSGGLVIGFVDRDPNGYTYKARPLAVSPFRTDDNLFRSVDYIAEVTEDSP